ncbi:hypothetical protein B0T25DRAFT_357120 [Lasiosphaeria hispida]|uniref:Uncharacterized protein n=1 Tax=Lasiosphaeria hispida TaxID=260671 RepID=A0AAJ0H7C7_9PEZI|nr:hypothetical protein B0T25DRAFT_357120 [Lasiosphaeria hispida]
MQHVGVPEAIWAEVPFANGSLFVPKIGRDVTRDSASSNHVGRTRQLSWTGCRRCVLAFSIAGMRQVAIFGYIWSSMNGKKLTWGRSGAVCPVAQEEMGMAGVRAAKFCPIVAEEALLNLNRRKELLLNVNPRPVATPMPSHLDHAYSRTHHVIPFILEAATLQQHIQPPQLKRHLHRRTRPRGSHLGASFHSWSRKQFFVKVSKVTHNTGDAIL